MGIYTRPDIEAAERDGSFIVRNKREIGNAGIDLRIKQLYTIPREMYNIQPFPSDPPTEMPREEFIKHLIKVPMEDGNFWLLLPGHHYLAKTEEEVFKEEKLFAPIFTRSSWARCGVRVSETDIDELSAGRGFEGTPLLSLTTFGTCVKLRPGDAPGQIVPSCGAEYVRVSELMGLIDRGILKIEKDRKQLKEDDLEFGQNGVIMTLDKKIRRYKGGIIDPKKPVDDFFEEIMIDEKGHYGDRREFFISSTAEKVSICSCYLGFVWHSMNHRHTFALNRMASHPNAPVIHPRSVFEGKITLENYPNNAHRLWPGMPIAYFGLRRLHSTMWSSIWKGKESRYQGQTEATSSRGHIKP